MGEAGDSRVPAVWIEGLVVSLGQKQILRNLNLCVPQGVIFCLLGPSGCGKTTLMKTLLGLYQPDAGKCRVLGCAHDDGLLQPGITGYVPQANGLHKELSVVEHLHLYAQLCNLDTHTTTQRVDFLVNRFHLQDHRNSRACDLGFGETKVLSSCVALVTHPKFAALDEPTVGVDPKCRAALWSHLREGVEQMGSTFFVTTHHVDEAVRADTLGVMKGGQIVVCAAPQKLVALLREPSLEKAYISVYSADFDAKIAALDQSCLNPPPPPPRPTTDGTDVLQKPTQLVQTRSGSKLRVVRNMCRLSMQCTYRHTTQIALGLVIVVLQFLMIGLCVGPTARDLPMSIVNEDIGAVTAQGTSVNYGEEFLLRLWSYRNDSTTWDTESGTPCVGCLDRHIALVRTQERFGVVHIPADFSQVIVTRLPSRVQPIPFELHLDASDSNLRAQILQDVFHAYANVLFAFDKGSELVNPESVVTPVRELDSMTNFFISSVFVATCTLFGIMFAGSIGGRWQDEGVLDRLQCMSIPSWAIALGIVSVPLPFLALDFPLRMLTSTLIMDDSLGANDVLLAIPCTLAVVYGSCVGLLCAVSLPDPRMRLQAMYFSLILQYLLAGGVWPVGSQPTIVYEFSHLIPLTWLLRSFRRIFLEGRWFSGKDAVESTIPVAMSCLLVAFAVLSLQSRTPVLTRLKRRFKKKRD